MRDVRKLVREAPKRVEDRQAVGDATLRGRSGKHSGDAGGATVTLLVGQLNEGIDPANARPDKLDQWASVLSERRSITSQLDHPRKRFRYVETDGKHPRYVWNMVPRSFKYAVEFSCVLTSAVNQSLTAMLMDGGGEFYIGIRGCERSLITGLPFRDADKVNGIHTLFLRDEGLASLIAGAAAVSFERCRYAEAGRVTLPKSYGPPMRQTHPWKLG